ncbi:MAG TPA: adenosine deaminase [Terriglobales bacterium]
MANTEFIHSLPKAELHLHLEGSVDPETLLELSRRHDATPLSPEQIDALYRYSDFHGFMMAFKAVTERLRTPEDFELIVYRLMERLHSQNVLHAEVYVSVGVLLWRGEEVDPIFAALERGRLRGERDFGASLLWIFDAVRHFGVEAAGKVFEKAVEYKDRNVVAIGIGGDERRASAELFKDLYRQAREDGLRLTAHAGETLGPESIWGALNIGAERIGHGLNAYADSELVRVLSERQVPVEICMTSNLRTGCLDDLNRHPVRRYFEEGLMVTLNTDDPAMFGTSLEREYQIAADLFEFTDEHLRELARNSFEASFLPSEKKLHFLRMLDNAVLR